MTQVTQKSQHSSSVLQTNEHDMIYNSHHATMDDDGAPAYYSQTLVTRSASEEECADMAAEGGPAY